MRVLGLDVGSRRIGVAISDPLGVSAQRLTTVVRQDLVRDVQAVATLAVQHQVETVVVGLPLTMKGTQGTQATQVMGFIDALKPAVSCPVRTIDERLTTAQGEQALLALDTSRRKRKHLIDQVAAQLILQSYLDASAKA